LELTSRGCRDKIAGVTHSMRVTWQAAMGHKLGHAKFQPSVPKETFSNLGLNKKGRKHERSSIENWPYFGNGVR